MLNPENVLPFQSRPRKAGKWQPYESRTEYSVDNHYAYIRIPLVELLPHLNFVNAGDPVIKRFTRREQQVLEGILASKSNKEIAGDLRRSERTVKFHVSMILKKLGVRRRVEVSNYIRLTSNAQN